jgi:hypothetical protein
MEKLKLSEEEIIKLGKKIVKELKIESRNNTLGLWMAHYIAQLILQVENCTEKDRKKDIQKECFDIILKLWANKEDAPNIKKPLDDLEPVIDILNVLKSDQSDIFQLWLGDIGIPTSSTWKDFTETVKCNSTNIIELCLYSELNSDLLEQKKEWVSEHASLLSIEEKKLLEHLNDLVNEKGSLISLDDDSSEEIDLLSLARKDRNIAILDIMEKNLQETSNSLKRLRESILSEE